MRFNIPHKRSLLYTAISLSLLPLSSQSFAQQDTPEVEEVVVTGSYIRRSEGFTQASSVTQLSADDLLDEGTLNIGEVVQNMSFVGGPSSSITNTIQGTSSSSTSIDLRGLGAVGEERRGVVLLDGAQLPAERPERAGQAEPGERDDGGEEPADDAAAGHDFPCCSNISIIERIADGGGGGRGHRDGPAGTRCNRRA